MSVDYDKLWTQTWGGMQDIGPVHRHTARIIVETMRPLGIHSVLDVGCGNGTNLAAIQHSLKIDDVAALDVSPAALEVARTRVRGDLRTMDIEKESMPFARQFDFVLSSQVIEHVHDDDHFLRAIRECTGRYAFIGTMQGRMRRSELHIGHLRNYTRAGLEQKMRSAGFDIVRVIEWGFPFYSPIYRSAIELVGGQAADIGGSRRDRWIANALYQLYKLNSSRHGDVLMVLREAGMNERAVASKYLRAYLAEAPLAAALWRSNEAVAMETVELPAPTLNLGCGFGEFARVFFAGKRVPEYGLDIDRSELMRALPSRAYRGLVQADARRIPFADASLGSVISISALEHVPDVAPAFREVARVLAPAGVFAFTVPLISFNDHLVGHTALARVGLRSAAERYAGALHRGLTHVNVWAPDRWTSLVTDAGFEVRRLERFIGPGATRTFEALLPAAFGSRMFRLAFGRRPPHAAPFIDAAERALLRFVGGTSADGSNLLIVAQKPA